MKRASLLLAAAALAGCGGSGAPAVTKGPLAIQTVSWNPNGADLGKVAAVTDLADTAIVLSDKGMSQLVAGALSNTDESVVDWASAGVVPAADGAGQWVVGVDAMGAIYTVDASSQLQDVSDRWGLLGQHVHAVASLGGSSAAFQLDDALAITDGLTVQTYTLPITGLAGGKGRLAGVSTGQVHVFDLLSGADSAYTVPGAAFVTFDADAKVVAASSHVLYREDDNGRLAQILDLGKATIHGLAGAATGTWVALDGELGLLGGSTLGISSGANLPADATLVASSSGDVWALSQGVLSRYSANPPGDQSNWQQNVLPVFDRVCSQCHLPGGTANVDLSYYGAWVARRALIGQRVVDEKPTSMPPTTASVQLTDADVAAIKAWVNGG